MRLPQIQTCDQELSLEVCTKTGYIWSNISLCNTNPKVCKHVLDTSLAAVGCILKLRPKCISTFVICILVSFLCRVVHSMFTHFVGETNIPDHWNFFALEEYLPGKFTKVLNNGGRVLRHEDDASKKFLAFAHYTLVKYKDMAMACDLQGMYIFKCMLKKNHPYTYRCPWT